MKQVATRNKSIPNKAMIGSLRVKGVAGLKFLEVLKGQTNLFPDELLIPR